MLIMQNGNEPTTKSDLMALETALRDASKSDLMALETALRDASKSDLMALETVLRGDLASKSDLKSLEGALRGDLKSLEDVLRGELSSKNDIKALEQSLRAELRKDWVRQSQLGGKFEDFIQEVRQEMREGRLEILKIVEHFAIKTDKVDRGQDFMGDRINTLEKKVKVLEENNPS